MTKLDADEAEVLAAFNQGALKSVATPAELAQFKAAARATAVTDQQANRWPSPQKRVAAQKRPPDA
jgi:hypothetical protein